MFVGVSFTQIVITLLIFVWVVFAALSLRRYLAGMQDKKVYAPKLKKKLIGDLFLSLLAMGLAMAVFMMLRELVV